MTTYRPPERVRLLVNAAHRYGWDETAQEALRALDAPDPAQVLAALATVTDGAVDMATGYALAAGDQELAGLPREQAYRLLLDRLLGLIPGPAPGADPDLGV